MSRETIVRNLLEKYGINDQRTTQWHTKRSTMITASEVTKAFRKATPAARLELLLRKIEGAKPGDGSSTNAACAWGNQFEPIAKRIYCRMNGGGDIVDTTCVVHPTVPFLGASPDGIYCPHSKDDPRWGKLVEFKCPISRKVDPSLPIPYEYYHQMQLQMECTGIHECDYAEMKFVTVPRSEWNKSNAPYKGRFAIYDSGEISYDFDTLPTWMASLKEKDDEYRVVHWELQNSRLEAVPKDPHWLETYLPDLTEFWDEVIHHRTHGTVPIKPEKVIETIQCEPPTTPPDAPSVPLPEVAANPVTEDDSSSVHKKNPTTLTFDFA